MHNPEDPDIKQAFMTFQSLVGIAEKFAQAEKYVHAAVSAQIAALYASYNHTGSFGSPTLEDILRRIGNKITGEVSLADVCERSDGTVRRVLHVLTAAKDVGGDTRFVWRWIHRDSGRSHSVALTNQLVHEVPKVLSEAVVHTGGTLHILDRAHVNIIERAKVLRSIAENADVVVLHLYPEDVVPLIAFANKTNMPLIIFVVHADHQFWLGLSITDLFVHLREAGMRLSEERRGIKREQMAFLPIPLDPISSDACRAQAKKRIGLSEDTVVLLSIARAIKYVPIRGPGFVDATVPILNKHKSAVLLVIGPANVDQWKTGYDRTRGRIVALGQRSDTHAFYEAADIYLDSFPFSSNTSLLEAGSYGLPSVSYSPYSKEAEVLAAGAPGLDNAVLRVANLDDYEETISRLIEDNELRVQCGERAKNEIAYIHSGDGWNRCLRSLYDQIAVTRSTTAAWDSLEQGRHGELDLLLHGFYSRHVPLGWVIGWYARDLPYTVRLQVLARMLKVNRSFSFSMFLPKWAGKRLGGRIKGWRHLPGIARWLSAKR